MVIVVLLLVGMLAIFALALLICFCPFFIIAAIEEASIQATCSKRICFQASDRINLAAIRGAKTSASDNCITPADLVCRPVHTQEMRFHSDYGAAWWMIELPRPFMLSNHRIGYRDPMKSVGYRIKVWVEALDEVDWTVICDGDRFSARESG